jgi:hypothetical protein
MQVSPERQTQLPTSLLTMTQLALPPTCPICGQPVQPDQRRRVAGIDLTRWPSDPPSNLFGHAACCAPVAELPILRRPAYIPGTYRP